jgi:lysozyme
MKISQGGIDFIVRFEGLLKKLPDGRYTAYKCPAGVWTIYAGCTEGVHRGMIVTDAEGRAMFARELAKFEAVVNRLVKVPLNQNEFDALVSFAYNCGEGALARSSILKRLNTGDRKGAAAAFGAWNKGGGRVLPGLVRRRKEEAALFLRPTTFKIPAADGATKPPKKPLKEVVRQSPTLRLQLNALWVALVAGVASIWDWLVSLFTSVLEMLPGVSEHVAVSVGAGQQLAQHSGLPWPAKAGLAISAACLLIAFIRLLHQRRAA